MIDSREKIKGIKGWLLFFVIIFILTLVVIAFQILQISIFTAYTDLVGSSVTQLNILIVPQPPLFLKIIHLFFLGILFILLLLTIIEIFRKKELGKKLVLASVWFGFLTAIYEKIIYFSLIPAYQEFMKSLYGAGVSSEFIKISIQIHLAVSLISSLVWAFIVSLYFLRSKRVKNTLKGEGI